MTSEKGALADFLERKFLEWAYHLGKIQRQADFAAYLGLEPAAFNRYLTGKRRNIDRETTDRIAEKLGEEIYDVVGYSNPRILAFYRAIRELDEDEERELLDHLEQIQARKRRRANVEAS